MQDASVPDEDWGAACGEPDPPLVIPHATGPLSNAEVRNSPGPARRLLQPVGPVVKLTTHLSPGFVDSRSERTIVRLGYQNDKNSPLPSWAREKFPGKHPPYKVHEASPRIGSLDRLLPAYLSLHLRSNTSIY
jgi:hypothetical protein